MSRPPDPSSPSSPLRVLNTTRSVPTEYPPQADDLEDVDDTTSFLPPSTSPSSSPRTPRTPRSPRKSEGAPLPATTASKIQTVITNNTGLILVGTSQFFFACMNISVKYFLSFSQISTLTLILIRMIITSIFCVSYLYYSGDSTPFLGPPEIRKLLCLRGFLGFSGLWCAYQSYKNMSVSDATTINFLSPTVIAILGYFLLGETMGMIEVLGGAFSLVGVIFVSRPPFIFGSLDEEEDGGGIPVGVTPSPQEGGNGYIPNRMLGVYWATAALFIGSCAYILIRAIGNRAHALHSLAYFSYLCVIVTAIVIPFVPGPFIFVTSINEFVLIILIGIFGFLGQMLLTLGLQREKAGRAGLGLYLSLFFALILEFIFLHTIPPLLSFLGAAIIIASAIWVAMNKPSSSDISDSSTTSEVEEELPTPVTSPLASSEYRYTPITARINQDHTPTRSNKQPSSSSFEIQRSLLKPKDRDQIVSKDEEEEEEEDLILSPISPRRTLRSDNLLSPVSDTTRRDHQKNGSGNGNGNGKLQVRSAEGGPSISRRRSSSGLKDPDR